jgi:hypothetical protein
MTKVLTPDIYRAHWPSPYCPHVTVTANTVTSKQRRQFHSIITYYLSDGSQYGATGLSTIVPKPTRNLDVMLFISLPVKSNKFTGMDLLGGGGKSIRGQGGCYFS